MQIKEIKDKKSHFLSDVLILVTGTSIAQIIIIIASPIITRLYSPEAFGVFALVISITSIIGVLASMRYEYAIMLPDSDEDAANLAVGCILLVCLISGLCIPVIWFGQNIIITYLNAQELGLYLWLVPIIVFFSGIFTVLSYWNTRSRNFRRLSNAQVSQSVASTGTQIGAGYAGYTSGGSLIAASIIGLGVATTMLWGQIWRDNKTLLKKFIGWEKIIQGFDRYKNFPKYSTLSSLLNTLSWQLPVLLLGAFFSPIISGYYALGMRTLQFPMNFIGNALFQVSFQRAAEAKDKDSISSLVENVFHILLIIGMVPILILALIGADFFSVVFGAQWREAGVYVQILSVWMLFWFLSSPLSMIFDVLEKQALDLKLNIVLLVTRIMSLVIGGLYGGPILALILFSFTGVLAYGTILVVILKTSSVNLVKIGKSIGANFLLFIPIAVILIIMKFLALSSIIIVLISGIALIIYYAYVMKTDPQVTALVKKSI
jgi:lipopolysaccharide exporter